MPGTILVVDDSAATRILINAKLTGAYYDVVEASDGAEALEAARRLQPDMILIDYRMPGLDGVATTRRLKAAPETAHIPVVMLTGDADRRSRLRGLEAGCDDLLVKPFDDTALLARVRSLTRMKMLLDELRARALGALPDAVRPELSPDFSRTALLCVDPDAARAESVRAAVARHVGCRWRAVASEGEARAALEAGDWDAVLLAPALPDADPLRLAAGLRARADTRDTVVLMMFEAADRVRPPLAMDMGVSDYLTVPPDYAELAARLKVQLRRKLYSDHLRRSVLSGLEMAVTDRLTGLHNRHFSDAELPRLVERNTALGGGLAALILDLDNFKDVNDRYGHAAGDRVLVEFARRLRRAVREGDLLARIGGEEFLVMLPGLRADAARQVAERIRAATAAPPFALAEAAPPRAALTVSIGLALHHPGEPAETLLARADAALYAAKDGGRNRVETADA